MATQVKVTGTKAAIQSFLDSGMQIAKVECGTMAKVHNEYNLFAYRIRKDYNGKVKIYQRGTALYFEKL